MDRLTCESQFHNQQAGQRAFTFLKEPQRLCFEDDQYLNHETWIRPAIERLGELTNLRVLDFGCGHGMAAVVFARQGAQVTGLDLTFGYLAEARKRAQANGVDVHLIQANGERLPFPDSSFDRIWGNAILHHLDVHSAGKELFRVLAPGGMAVFAEPWGENPFLSWARRRLPYHSKERTADEEPLRQKDIEALQTIFPQVQVQGFQLLSMIRRALPPSGWLRELENWDHMLLARIPRLQHYCRYVVLTLRR
jgi:SAM-dependent methyltransferase